MRITFHHDMLVLCLTAGVFITPCPPGNEMVSSCLWLRWHYACIKKYRISVLGV